MLGPVEGDLTRRRRHPRPWLLTLPWRPSRGGPWAAAVLLAPLGAWFVTGCGSSDAGVGAGVGAATTTHSRHFPGCRPVKAPVPREARALPRPTLKLDPGRRYTVALQTNCGRILISLDVERAPKVTASFAYLVRRGFYNGLTFHRVVSGFLIQGGDPEGDGSGGPGYTVVEPPPPGLQYTRGVVAMAKAEDDPSGSAGSQFFIVTGQNDDLPDQYALLGNVVGSESAVAAISAVPTSESPEGEESQPRTPVVISSATLSVG